MMQKRLSAELDRSGRVKVAPDTSVPGHPDIFVIGDLAYFAHQDDEQNDKQDDKQSGKPLPAVATVAIQQGQYVARLIEARLNGQSVQPFHYRDKGNLAVIGRNAAVADLGPLRFGGYFAWLIWVFVHISQLIEFDKKLIVLIQWAWNYITRKRGARLITNIDSLVLVEEKKRGAASRR
jgi:NADH dehydrogenase